MSVDADKERFFAALGHMSDEITQLRSEIEQRPKVEFTEEMQDWVRIMMEKQALSVKFRRAMIEKSLSALIFGVIGAFVTFLGVLLVEYAKNHGWKP